MRLEENGIKHGYPNFIKIPMLSVINIFLWRKVCNTEFSLWHAKDKTPNLRMTQIRTCIAAIILPMSQYMWGKNYFEH